MKNLAEKLGIAASTVSRALKSDPRISPETRERVIALAREYGYKPNPLVSALMANRKGRKEQGEIGTLALVTDYRGNRSWKEKDVCQWAYSGICNRAADLGYKVTLFPMEDYGYDSQKLQKALIARSIRGVILGYSRGEDQSLSLDPEHFSIAGLSTYFGHLEVDRSNFYGFYNVLLALDALKGYGYRRPALVTPALNNSVSQNAWSAAFLDWQRQNKIDRPIPPFIPQTATDEQPRFKDWAQENQPDALLVYKVPVRRYLREMNLRVPEDIGLAYLYRNADEIGMAAGIDGKMGLVGAAVVDLVVDKMNRPISASNLNNYAKEVLIKGTWHPGPTIVYREEQRSAS